MSVHIATRDRPAEVYGLLVSLFNQPFEEWDLVIVDESENPIKTQKYINDMLMKLKFDGHGVHYHHNQNRRGISAVRNLCVREDPFKNEYIIRIDDDSIVDPRYIERLVSIIRRDKKKVIGAVGGLVPTFGIDYWRILDKPTVFETVKFRDSGIEVSDLGGSLWKSSLKILPSEHLRSSFLFRRSAWEKIGGFDESQGGFTGWREETTFNLDLAWGGYGIVADLDAVCWHVRTFRGGGSQHSQSPNYRQELDLNERHFNIRNLRKYKRLGNPYDGKWYKRCLSVIK